uniref:G_PROTEIN_RECEP_F1_2 domain-containing protein n=1 Tax=Strongyloides papillosus TaxID=174720 RepID=A0A0N5B4N3_STREA
MAINSSSGWTSITLDPGYTSYLLSFQTMNMIFGSIGIIINILLIIILLSSEFFRCYRRLILLLAIGDLCNCIYVFMQGYERKEIYLHAFKTGYVKNQTYWSCALKVFDWMGLLGSLIPHIVTFIMSIERTVAFKYPLLYERYFSKGDVKACSFCCIYVIINMILAFTLAYLHRNVPSRYFCGRKVSYTYAYISFIYGMNVFGYVSCFIVTLSIMVHLKLLIRIDKKV